MKLTAMIKKMCPSNSELSIPARNCSRLVILGSSKVGKTAIVSRFLTGRFEDAYTPTVEDFHRKFYAIRGELYQLDILDTSGHHPFPATRRLSILTDPGHQVLPQEQTQGAGGRAPGAVRQQGRPRPPPRGGAGRGPAAAGRRPPALRLLRGLGQKEQQPGPHVPGALRHGRAARGDEPGPAPPAVRTALRGAAPGAAGREAAARRRPGGRPGHRGALRAPAQRAQRPPVRAREGGRPGQGQGALRDQLGLPLPQADSRTEGRPCRLKVKSRSGPALSFKCPGVFPPPSPARQLGGENGGGLVICFGRKANWVTGAPPPPPSERPLAPPPTPAP
ncbi:dexamethasone-induced Ras-related protein 1 isoform X2 [Myotis yumanensis]|uniref:dexamethasone-induced Ras-related protein 1 isoform X2 n=1 Tax=Myotis yumanensis TaxID=159337 RepID=UPI0038D3978B